MRTRIQSSISNFCGYKNTTNKRDEAVQKPLTNFGNNNQNITTPKIEAKVRAHNLCSISNISYRNVQNINLNFGSSHEKVAGKIAKILNSHKTQHAKFPCIDTECPACNGAIQNRILPFIQQNKTIQMTMAGFPFKATSKNKCISESPDMAEVISLKFLNSIITDIKKDYEPGAKLTIFNDGLMFTPIVVNPNDRQAMRYIKNIKGIINHIGAADNIEIKSITDFYTNLHTGREDILKRYPHDLCEIKQNACDPNNKEVDLEYYTGSKKFATEKMAGLEDGELEEIIIERYKGKPDEPNGIQYQCYISEIESCANGKLGKNKKEKLAGDIACDSIRRAKAWGAFIEEQQPNAIRLSSHPQPCGSSKLGIYLTKDHNNWGTPWQLTAIDIGNGEFILGKRQEADNLGFELIYPHFKLPDNLSAEEKEIKINKIKEKK